MNKVHMFGVSAQPEVKNSQSGTKFATFGLGLKQKFSDKSLTFFKCVAFDKQAEWVEKNLTEKNARIFVHGRLEKDSVDDSFYIVCQEIHFIPNTSTY